MAVVMDFCLLGPLVVRRGETVVPVPRGNQRALLATLLLDANQVVSVDEIAEILWEDAPPPSAVLTIRNYVRRLRHALGDDGRSRISTQPAGYLIRVGADELDVSRFQAALESARAAARGGSWDQAAARARTALSLWRGEPLADVESDALALREVPRLAEMQLQTLETRIEADLHLGRHTEVTAELKHLADAHPLREHLQAQLMLALYRSGRQGEALAAYRQARQMLVGELGTEPGAELREMHQRILAADPALAVPEPARITATPGTRARAEGRSAAAVPRQLPGSAAQFVGRWGELAALDQALDRAGQQAPGTVIISAIGGMAGVGKSALAVHWAHQVAPRFPDGQLYVNLRGFDSSGAPAAHAEVIRGFLDALGVPADRIPPAIADQAGLYRSLLADKRVLIVLDNARDEQQVRPLLPAGRDCLVIVTSRNQMVGLAAIEGVRLLALDVLTDAEGRQMLAARLGGERAASEPDAVSEIAALCARLPLALAVTAARAAARPNLRLSALAAELRGARDRLDALDTGDPAASVRTAFSWSSQQLGVPAARMFRLLGLHPGPDISVSAAASLAAISPGQARRALDELTRANLLTEHTPGRFTLHDLLRAYATEQAHTTDDEQARRDTTGRILDHYLHTAHTASLLLNPSREPIPIASPGPGVTPEHLADNRQALEWFDAEHPVLIAAVALAAGTGFDIHAWQLPWAMADFLDRRCRWHDWAATQRTAVASATRLGVTAAQAVTHRLLASAHARLGDYDQASAQLAACLELYRELDDRIGEARAHQALNWVAEQQHRHDDALGHAEQALALCQAAGYPAGQAAALNAVGWCHALLGDYHQARAFCQDAIALNRELGIRHGEAAAWDSLGYAEHHLGRYRDATDCYQHALGLCREVSDRFNEASILIHLGDTRHAAGDPREARDARQLALAILDDLDHPDAEKVRAQLTNADGNAHPEPAAAGSAPHQPP
jgi:DNA-binding SARP family transcriptional activator